MQKEHKVNSSKDKIEKYENVSKGGINIKNKKRIFIIIATLVFIFSGQISYARYITTEVISGKQEIATPILTLEEGKTIQIDEKNNIGYYEFSIKNFNEENVSETGFLYTIEIISNIGEAVEFELYDGEKQVSLQNLKTGEISIIGNEKVEQKYKLKITYNATGEAKEESIEKIQIKVHSEQEKL